MFEPVRASRSDWQLIGAQAPAGNAAPVTGLSTFLMIPAGNCRGIEVPLITCTSLEL